MDLHTILALDRPLIGFDLESTGSDPVNDRIVQIGIIKVGIDGTVGEACQLVNPERPIPPGATATHHITDEMVKDAPKFSELAPRLAKGFHGADVAGFNNGRFDNLLIEAEFRRAGIEVKIDRTIDVFLIFQRMKKHSLEAAVEEYLGEKIEGAHDALVDTRYTLRVLAAQLQRHSNLPRSVAGLHEMFFIKPAPGFVDVGRKFKWEAGEAVVAFGKKHPGKTLREVCAIDRGFFSWMVRSDFPEDSKRIALDALNGVFPVPPAE